MKILMCLFNIQDLGGIINHAEHLIHGLKALGHEVTLVRLEDRRKLVNSSSKRETQTGFSGIPYDQRAGWVFPMQNRVAVHSVNWKQYVKPYDLILWEVPVPPKGWEDYDFLYRVRKPQIAFIHDGNAVKMYPHIMKYANRFEYFACVHPCALGNMQALGAKNTRLVVNPQAHVQQRFRSHSKRPKSVYSLQTFKAWKHVDEFVAAIPHLNVVKHTTLSGGGIEYYYMTSKDKRKPKYGTIWEDAIKNGMHYTGYVSETERDQIMQRNRFLLDTSYSKTYAQYGSHFNRVMVDGIINGCVPILRDWAMTGNGIFKPEQHYLEIPVMNEVATSKLDAVDFADYLDYFADAYSERTLRHMIMDAQSVVLRKFDSKVVARRLLK